MMLDISEHATRRVRRQMTDDERSQLARAAGLITQRYLPDRHSVAAVVTMSSGEQYVAVNVDTYVGRAAICAEAAAIATAMTAGETEIVSVIAVRHPRPHAEDQSIHVVSPCGICREMIADYGPSAVVAVPTADGPVMLSVTDLLPEKFVRR